MISSSRLVVVVVVTAALGGMMHAQDAVVKSVVGSGATRAVAQGVRLAGTAGQTIVGRSAGQPLGIAAGFWNNVVLDARTGGGTSIVRSDKFDNTFSVSPHPVSAVSTIRFRNDGAGDVTVEVLDNEGKRVRALDNKTVDARDVSMLFDSEGLPSGSYTLRISTPRGETLKRVVVVH